MKIKIFIFLIFFSNLFFSQKRITDYKEIVFLRSDSIYDFQKNKSSLQKMSKISNKILKTFTDSLGINIEKDSTEFKKFSDSIINNINNQEIKNFDKLFHYKIVNDSIIERFTTDKHLKIQEYPIFINRKTSKETYNFPYKENEELFDYQFTKIKDLKITKIKKERKTINGIKCFKLLVSFIELEDNFLPENKVKQELWVTTNSKQIFFHPTYKIKEVLENYYPLEIFEESEFNEGTISYYKIFKLE